MATIIESYKQVKKWKAKSKHKPPQEKDGTTKISDLQILIEFDTTSRYGPCIGITRLERWERANRFYLTPPQVVKEIILKHESDIIYTESIWCKYQLSRIHGEGISCKTGFL